MKSKEALLEIYSLLNNGIKIWVEKDRIKLLIPDGKGSLEDYKNVIQDNKQDIINSLIKQKVYSSNYEMLIFECKFSQIPLSFAQERLWFLSAYESNTNFYNTPIIFQLSDDNRVDILCRSIHSIVSRHEVLRTLIKEDSEGNGYQVILNDQESPFKIEISELKDVKELIIELSKDVKYNFNFGVECPIRVKIYSVPDENSKLIKYYISIVVHHIAFDGWSIDIFLRELETYYSYYLEQESGYNPILNLSELTIQYKDFALWQRSYLSDQKLSEQINYWKDKLTGYENLNLITDRPRSEEIDYTGKDIYFEIDEETSIGLRNLAKKLGVSLYSVLLSGYYLMLRAYTNQDDIVVGTPVSNRHYAQIEHLIGFFVNSLVLRMKIDSNQSIKDFIEEVGHNVIESQLYQDLPFEKLVEVLEVERISNIHPIFQVMFVLQNFGSNTKKNDKKVPRLFEQNIRNELKELYNIARFDLYTLVDDTNTKLKVRFNYVVNLYNENTINSLAKTYQEIMQQFSCIITNDLNKEKSLKIKDLKYFSNLEEEKVIYRWNQTKRDYPNNKTIQQLFEEQVEKTPNNIALIDDNTVCSYKALNEKANQLGHYLRKQGIRSNVSVVIILEDSFMLIESLLGILKSGASYLPIPVSTPIERINHIIEDSKASYVITLRSMFESINSTQAKVILLDRDIAKIRKESSENLNLVSHLEDIFAVLYTSGSTGEPKGVITLQSSYINRFNWMWRLYPFSNAEVCCYKTSIGFVDSIWEIFGSLLRGVKLVIIPKHKVQDTNLFLAELSKYNISRITVVPTLLETLLNEVEIGTFPDTIEIVTVSGDVLSSKLVKRFLNLASAKKLLNLYGSTEVGADGTCFLIEQGNHYHSSKGGIIGKPIDNMKGYVLNKDMMPLPIGAVGELYIGGVGLARGYLNRPDLTQERFIANPFQTAEEKKLDKNGRLYKTGDLVRWLPDGNLEYIGRNDFQVKIRGHRVELGEVEEVLSAYDGIKQSVVVVRDHLDIREDESSKYLVGYYITEDDIDWQEKEILTYLQSRLPDYMVPTRLVRLKEFPLTINGKLDRKKLPEPDFTIGDNYVAPSTDLEKQICKIWSEVLRLPENTVGVHDDFFRLGGNSILAIKVASSMSKSIAIIGVATIFKYRNIEQLSVFLHEMISSNIEGNEYEF